MTSHHGVTGKGYGIYGKLSRLRRAIFQQIPQPRRRRDGIENPPSFLNGLAHPVLAKPCRFDKNLLMGGTFWGGTYPPIKGYCGQQ